jgi:hypothetical protein
MEGCKDMRVKQRAVIESLTAERIPRIYIHRRMHAVYGDKCVDVSTVRRRVRQAKQQEAGEVVVSGGRKRFF